jgi:Beta galactosidase small chain
MLDPRSIEAKQVESGVVRIIAKARLAAGDATQTNVYAIRGDSSVEIEARFSPDNSPLPPLPRFGMQARVSGDLRNVEW